MAYCSESGCTDTYDRHTQRKASSSQEQATVALQPWTRFSEVNRVLADCLADLGGMGRFVSPGQTVVIKPNLTANGPADSGGTTHIELVEAIIDEVQRCNPNRIIVAEGTGRFGTSLDTAFPTGGWREMAIRQGIELYNLDGGPHVEVKLDNPVYPDPLPFSKLILDADLFISVPCLKTHMSADYTVALKNSYALTPQWKRSEIHRQYLLEESLVDLNRIRKPDLIVVDAWDGAEGIAGGTDFTRPAHARLMLVSNDPVAVDIVSREIMELTAPTRYLDWAIEAKVGIGDLGRIHIKGATLQDCRHPFMSPTEELVGMMPGVTIHDQNACSGCRCAALSAVRRFARQKLLHPIDLVFGFNGDEPQTNATTVVIGDCAQPYENLGLYIPGCPSSIDAIVQALESTECICQKCREIAQTALASVPKSCLAHLRVTAAGAQVFAGNKVKRGEWHLELIVGDCMERYAHVVSERGAQFGLDVDRDVIWLRGCPVTPESVQKALRQFCKITPVSSASLAETPH